MKAFAVRFAVLAAVGVALAVCGGNLSANNAADPTIKEIMKKANAKSGGLCPAIGAGLKEKEPNWADLQAKAKELVPFAKAMPANKPPKGSEEDWKKVATAYAAAAENLAAATEAKDAKAAAEALKVINNCAGCHKAHK